MKKAVIILAVLTVLLSGICASASSTSAVIDDFTTLERSFSDLDGYDWARESIEYLAEKRIVSGVDFGVFSPAKSVTRAEFIKLICTACGIVKDGAAEDFDDVAAEDWYYVYVSSAREAGIIDIYTGRLEPAAPISREDMCYIAYKALEKTGTLPAYSISADFADTEEMASYAKESICSMKALEVINGKGDNLFDPKGNATRAESAKIVYNVLNIFTENYNK